MKIEQKLQKRINTIIQITGDYPEEIEITEEEYNELASRNSNIVTGFTEVLDRDGQPLNKFMNVKLKIKEIGGTNEY